MVEQLHFVLYDYYSKLSISFTSLNAATISSPHVADDLSLGHIVYKCLVKMAAWLWNRLDKTGKDEFVTLQPWVSCGLPIGLPSLTSPIVSRLFSQLSNSSKNVDRTSHKLDHLPPIVANRCGCHGTAIHYSPHPAGTLFW